MKRLLLTLFIAVLIAAAFGAGVVYSRRNGSAAPKKGERKVLYWVDPMHPAYKSDKPGIAPDCGMKLEPVYADEGPAMSEADRKVLFYRDPQDPNYKSDKPGLNPETGNELEPVYAGDPSSMPPGAVQITPEKQQLIGVKYGVVEYTTGAPTVRAVGKVVMDETRVHHVHSRTEGWVQNVYVNFTGDLVRKGQPLLTLYSPELLASQQEYLLALKARDIMKGSSVRGVAGDNNSLVEAARRRLQLWNLSESQIEQIERTQKPVTNVTIYSDVSGYVLTRNAFHNQKVMPETELYTVADLSRVWVLANVFEYEASQVRLGQPATVTLPYQAGKTFRARVAYVQPQIDPATRSMQVRLELERVHCRGVHPSIEDLMEACEDGLNEDVMECCWDEEECEDDEECCGAFGEGDDGCCEGGGGDPAPPDCPGDDQGRTGGTRLPETRVESLIACA